MKAKNGISLIVLVITIVVIIILAAAVILSLGQNNPINTSKVASLTQTRDNLESAVQIYLSNEFTKCQGDYTAKQIIEGQSAVAPSTYTSTALVKDAKLGSTDFAQIDEGAAKTLLGIDVPVTGQTWYLNPNTGKVMVKFPTDAPAYIYEDGNTSACIAASLAGFVTK